MLNQSDPALMLRISVYVTLPRESVFHILMFRFI
jgi:hypothetical protein